MVQKTLSIVILVLTVLTGAVIFSSATQVAPSSINYTQPPRADRAISERVLSIPSQVISRLSLFPMLKKGPTPLAVVIENHEDARPHQEGLEHALLIQEFLVEGFISRFVVLFDAGKLPPSIGPVRSLRPYFLDAVFPWTRIVFHAGGSPEALSRVQNGSEFYARNLLYFDDENGSLRNKHVAPPHNLFLKKAFLQKLLEDVPEMYVSQVTWPPYTLGVPPLGEPAQSIKLNFFSSLHNVTYAYQPLAQKYTRKNGDTLSPARPSNVVIIEVPIDTIGEYGRLFMHLTGQGNAILFHSGMVWEAQWSRKDLSSPFVLTDSEGNELPFLQGQTWVTVLPTLERVSWE